MKRKGYADDGDPRGSETSGRRKLGETQRARWALLSLQRNNKCTYRSYGTDLPCRKRSFSAGQGSQGYCVRLVCVPANEGVLTSATSTTTASTGEQRELRVCAGMRRSKGRVQIPPSPPQSPGQRLFFFASAMKCAIPATIATCSTLSSLAVMREVSERSARCALVLCAVSVT